MDHPGLWKIPVVLKAIDTRAYTVPSRFILTFALSPKIVFVLANSVGPGEMTHHYVALYLSLHCLSKG